MKTPHSVWLQSVDDRTQKLRSFRSREAADIFVRTSANLFRGVALLVLPDAPAAEERCDCHDCVESEEPCAGDCDRYEECRGCRSARLEREDIEFDIDRAQGRIK